MIQDKVAGLRRFGSAALDLAYIAAGRFDVFWERDLSPWDFAAGVILVREAGGYVTDLEDKERTMVAGDIIAGNSTLHREVLTLLRDAAK
jgi:myo-inositol-1(or 4)-monophosphatase